jgi:hypothetical protein
MGWLHDPAANDPMKRLEEAHNKNPGDVNTKNLTIDVCGALINKWVQERRHDNYALTGCSQGNVEVALVIATKKGKFSDFHWHRKNAR